MKINYGENWKNVELLYDNVIVKVAKKKKEEKKDDEWKKSESGLYIPETSEEKSKKKEIYGVGEVVSVGDGYHGMEKPEERVPLSVKNGDYIVINITDPVNGNIVMTEEVEDTIYEYRLIREQHILMKTNSNLSDNEKKDVFITE